MYVLMESGLTRYDCTLIVIKSVILKLSLTINGNSNSDLSRVVVGDNLSI